MTISEHEKDAPGVGYESTAQAAAGDIAIRWREVPTILVDQIVGFAAADGVARLSFGELVFNPGGGIPNARLAVTLASSVDGWKRILIQVSDAINQLTAAGAASAAEGEIVG